MIRGLSYTGIVNMTSNYTIKNNVKTIYIIEMKNELKVAEFNKKQNLLDYVNQNSHKLNIVSISSTQEAISYKHFLWYYDK